MVKKSTFGQDGNSACFAKMVSNDWTVWKKSNRNCVMFMPKSWLPMNKKKEMKPI
jgi:hypothetical protein